MKELIKISEITNAILVEFEGSPKYGGTLSYQLGKPEELKEFLKRLFKTLEIDNSIKWEVK